MTKKEGILKPRKIIRGGAKLPHYKHTAEIPSKKITPPEFVTIPMSQHIGVPCAPLVNVGDKVFVGTKIGSSDAFVSAPIFSSVSGTVEGINKITLPSGTTCDAVVIKSDGLFTPDPSLKPFTVKNAKDLSDAAKECGLVGAGFPTYIKLISDKEKPIDTLIVNGAECEPFITADYRECLENSDDILHGIYLIKEVLGLKQVIIGIEDNKPNAIKVLYDIASHKKDVDDKVKLMKLPSRYPQGAEKVLIYSATGRKLPLGKLPADVGCIVMNITSIGVLYRFIKTGMPLVEKRITVDGNAVKNSGNYICPIGTPISHILENAEVEDAKKIILGGPMMGTSIFDTSTPLLKMNNAILAFKDDVAKSYEPTNCINCGRCSNACPMNLKPRLVETEVSVLSDAKTLEKHNIMYCLECGSCVFSCPAKRPLVQAMRLAKNTIRKAGKK